MAPAPSEAGAGVGVGFEFPARKVSWLKRDVLLYNLSIGCKADEQHFIYVRPPLLSHLRPGEGVCVFPPMPSADPSQEGHPNFSAFPTLPLGLGKSAHTHRL